jgi:hypothetical protein
VYGPQGDDEMILFLQGLTGDFNLIYKASDKNNSNFNWVMMDLFRRVIDDLTLKEIPLHGCRYTSSNQQDHPVLVKLYSLLLGGLGVVFFPNVLLQSTASRDSDNCPLVLGLRDNNFGKRRFHFEAFWPKLEGFHDAVQIAWDSVVDVPCPYQAFLYEIEEDGSKPTGMEWQTSGPYKIPTGFDQRNLTQIGDSTG